MGAPVWALTMVRRLQPSTVEFFSEVKNPPIRQPVPPTASPARGNPAAKRKPSVLDAYVHLGRDLNGYVLQIVWNRPFGLVGTPTLASARFTRRRVFASLHLSKSCWRETDRHVEGWFRPWHDWTCAHSYYRAAAYGIYVCHMIFMIYIIKLRASAVRFTTIPSFVILQSVTLQCA